MTLKEELEILRGEPIEVFEGDPMDIPCIETSDPERLCKNPVVSVHMITYNHEPYIRQAIEGVMMQKTDFEFELVIGEDCSQDKTREICFEYQKKYPDKIRVLWWHENVSKLGGNGRRTRAHCRGEFIAFCEGDDYWIDEYKLAEQVAIMESHKNINVCFCGGKVLEQDTQITHDWHGGRYYDRGFNLGSSFFTAISYTKLFSGDASPEDIILTATSMVRKSAYEVALNKFDIFAWRLLIGDAQLWMALSLDGDVFLSSKQVAVYRRNRWGVTYRCGDRVYRDSLIVRLYFLIKWSNGFKVYAKQGLSMEHKVPFIVVDNLLAELRRMSIGAGEVNFCAISKAVRELMRTITFEFNHVSFLRCVKWIWLLCTGSGVLFKIHRKHQA